MSTNQFQHQELKKKFWKQQFHYLELRKMNSISMIVLSNYQPVFKITEIRNTVNKKFDAYTNEFKINFRKNVISDKNDVFYIFEKMIKMTIKNS